VKPLERLGIGVGWEIGTTGLEWTELFRQIRGHVRYLETAPVYDTRGLEKVREDLDPDFRFVLHYSGLSLPSPTTRIEQHVPVIDGLCQMLDSPWFVEDLGYWSIEGTDLGGFFPVILSEDALRTSIDNMNTLKRRVSRPYVPENPPYSAILGDIPVTQFMARLSEATDTPYLIDVGHLYSYLSIRGDDVGEALAEVNWERVIELHVAGGEMVRGHGRDRWIYDDNHSKPIQPEVLDLLAAILPRATAVGALTVEVDYNQEAVGVANPLDTAVSNVFSSYAVAERFAPHLVKASRQVQPA